MLTSVRFNGTMALVSRPPRPAAPNASRNKSRFYRAHKSRHGIRWPTLADAGRRWQTLADAGTAQQAVRFAYLIALRTLFCANNETPFVPFDCLLFRRRISLPDGALLSKYHIKLSLRYKHAQTHATSFLSLIYAWHPGTWTASLPGCQPT